MSLKNHKESNYIAGMVLSGVGDALGYKNGHWEFCKDVGRIYRELKDLGGLDKLNVKLPQWRVSDDTVMHLATAEALIENDHITDKFSLYKRMAEKYIESMKDMKGRAPGITCQEMCFILNPCAAPNGLLIPFNPSGGGCGAAMRSMCIGFRYPRPCDLEDLIAVSIESGRLTHHHPTGYLGSLASALFTSYAVQGKPIAEWGIGLLDTSEKAMRYIANTDNDVKEPLYTDKETIENNIKASEYFKWKWECYLRMRNIAVKTSEPRYALDEDNVRKRDQLYTWLSFDNVGGASGHDAPMIAYDALLQSNGNWTKLCDRAIFHGGDSDSTGVIAGCLYGVLYGLGGVPPCNYKELEYRTRLEKAGKDLFAINVTWKCDQSEPDSNPIIPMNTGIVPCPTSPIAKCTDTGYEAKCSSSETEEEKSYIEIQPGQPDITDGTDTTGTEGESANSSEKSEHKVEEDVKNLENRHDDNTEVQTSESDKKAQTQNVASETEID